MLHHIIYMSQAKPDMTVAMLAVILMQCRSGNERRHIMGALVYGEGQFMQIIEGEHKAVTELYDIIAQDHRHQNIFKLADKSIEARSFAQWSMAFHQASEAEFDDLTGYVTPAQLAAELASTSAADELFMTKMKELISA